MSAARNVRKQINLFVDGRGQAGQIQEYNPPALTLKTEEFQGGGMGGPIELTMGHEALNCDFSLVGYDPHVIRLFGVSEGRQVQFTARQALESFDGTVTALVHNMRGKIKSIEPGTSKPGEMAPLKITVALSYYKETQGGAVNHEIDPENMVFKSGGVDLFEAFRSVLGI